MSRAPWIRKQAGAMFAAWCSVVLLVCMFAGCSSCAHGATLTISGTAPAFDNAGTCAAPQLTTLAGSALVMVHVQVTGPASFVDSLAVNAGAPFTFARTGPAGTYTVRAWAKDAGGVGCDTTLTITTKNPPWKVRL